MHNNLGVVIIAAGNSSRLGQAKQLLKVGQQSFLQKVISMAELITQRRVVVLGHEHQRYHAMLNELNQPWCINQQWQIGMGTSIACGVEQLEREQEQTISAPPLAAVMVLLCDQYQLNSTDLKKLLSQWTMNEHRIIASRYFDNKKQQEVLGAPAIFPCNYFEQLKSLSQTGARKLLMEYRSHVTAVNIASAAVDLDTQDDLQQLKEYNASKTENNYD